MDKFENIWNFLQRRMKSGTVVSNWTAYNGYLGDNMTVVNISNNAIEVKAPKAKNIQNVPKKDFQKVWAIWSDYKNGKIKRHELRDITRFSKCIISIFRWYEEEVK